MSDCDRPPIRPVHACTTSRIFMVAFVFALLCLPAIKRAVEHTPIDRDTAAFKFSKTLELPHKKVCGTPIAIVVTAPPVSFSELRDARPVQPETDVLRERAGAPAPSRAPPSGASV